MWGWCLMVQPRASIYITKMEGKAWWTVTLRLGHRKYEGDMYFLGARYRIASLTEQLEQTQRRLEAAREELGGYYDRYGELLE